MRLEVGVVEFTSVHSSFLVQPPFAALARQRTEVEYGKRGLMQAQARALASDKITTNQAGERCLGRPGSRRDVRVIIQ